MKISRTCAVCGKILKIEIDDESGKILSLPPDVYFGRLGSIKGNPEYWECAECDKT
ncbi:hypothetical protein KAR91_00825 [Candidatus Pacearchaeota archaeon]|nr:hypothetical protein [Candidatus Pacearchaeota archaeon]